MEQREEAAGPEHRRPRQATPQFNLGRAPLPRSGQERRRESQAAKTGAEPGAWSLERHWTSDEYKRGADRERNHFGPSESAQRRAVVRLALRSILGLGFLMADV